MAQPAKSKNSKLQYLESVPYLLSVLVKISCLCFESVLESPKQIKLWNVVWWWKWII